MYKKDVGFNKTMFKYYAKSLEHILFSVRFIQLISVLNI